MDNWDDYRVILALARGQSLRAAAKQLSLNHATVSRRLAALNHRYAAPVFENSPQGLRLTALGLRLLAAAEQMELLIQGNRRDELAATDVLQGDIRLSLPPAIAQWLLLEELMAFQQQYPRIRLHIHCSYTLASLDSCEADIVVRVSNNPDEHLVGRRLFPVWLAYYCRPDYLTKPANRLGWITASGTPDWIATSPYPNAGVALVLDDLVLRHQVAAQRGGLVRGACYIADQMPQLQRIGDGKPHPFQDIWLLTHENLRAVPRIKLLMDYLADCLHRKRDLVEGRLT
ncbi:LysR family transcriptional regulator [Shewanella zhangzhouensis]|uniref:LysR family transcriptional regulator n=1 Tax=Shewanella zhangzhouensis TaxID=2864213 RepID=UPI001C6549D7|nr:LysR family transcriptional regulator [Shewanella zhangzhouensis]QYK05354.1 LysR family transcriptional regulator [Shewanella zhangzhouensis]